MRGALKHLLGVIFDRPGWLCSWERLFLLRNLKKRRRCHDSKNVTWKCNFSFLLSFILYSKSFGLQNVYEIHWNWIAKGDLEMDERYAKFVVKCICRLHTCQTGHSRSLEKPERLQSVKRWNMHVQSVQIYWFSFLWRSCRCGRRGYWNCLLTDVTTSWVEVVCTLLWRLLLQRLSKGYSLTSHLIRS